MTKVSKLKVRIKAAKANVRKLESELKKAVKEAAAKKKADKKKATDKAKATKAKAKVKKK